MEWRTFPKTKETWDVTGKPPPFQVQPTSPYIDNTSPTFLKSILSLKSEFCPQIHTLFFQGFELRTELSGLKMLVMAGPEQG